MDISSALFLGMMLPLLGLAILGLVLALTRLAPKSPPRPSSRANTPLLVGLEPHKEAVLVVEEGGRVIQINRTGREWFNAWEDVPNLERLARRTRPAEAFLALCTAEGQARFYVDGRAVDGASYSAAAASGVQNNPQRLVVALKRPQLVLESEAGDQGQPAASGQAFNIFSEISQSMASSLELEPTLLAILEAVERLVPADFPEVSVWDGERKCLLPYQLTSQPDGERRLEKLPPRPISSAAGEDAYAAFLVKQLQPLHIGEAGSYREVRPAPERRTNDGRSLPFRAYLGVPLQAAGELVGTLELASLTKDAFSSNDFEVLRLLSGQAAIALHNALAYEMEQRRALELAGLARLAQAVTALREPKDLFARLVNSIAPLLRVDVLGFLIYDENRRLLQGQSPFHGLPDDALEWSRVELPSGSPAEVIWQAQETILAAEGQADPRLQTFGLDHLAVGAGMRQTVLVPLASGGHPLGYLIAANKSDGTSFNSADLRLLSIITGQVAPIIENAWLVHQSSRRAQRAETLRRIASLTGSTATLDEILKYSLQDLSRLLLVDYAAIFLLDEGRNELRLHRPSLFGVSDALAAALSRLSLDDQQARQSVTISQRAFLSDDVTLDDRILPLYHPLVVSLDLRAALVVPLVSRNRGIGEIMLGSSQPGFFNQGDLQSVTTAAGQLAAAIEQAHLYTQTDEGLRRRLDHFTALTRISRELNSTLNLEYLIQLVYDEALQATRADCGTILLFDLFSANQSSAPPGAPRRLLFVGDPPGDSLPALEGQVLATREAILVDDFNGSRPDMPAAHIGIRSALVAPILYQEQVAGLIHLHARQPQCFDTTAREVVEALAVQAAIALGNAHRYQEQIRRSELLNRRVETLAKLLEISQSLQTDQPLAEALENIAFAIQDSSPFNTVLVSVYNQETCQLERLASAGISLPDMKTLRAHTQPWTSVQQVLQPEFRTGAAYFIPHERMPVLPAELHALNVLPSPLEKDSGSLPAFAWHPDDMLVVPLLDAAGEPLGLISVDAPRNNLRPDRLAIDTLEIFSSQAALLIDGQRRIGGLGQRLQVLEQELDQNQQALESTQSSLTELLHKDMEQTLVVQRLGQQSQRLNAVLVILAAVMRQESRIGVLETLAQELLAQLGMEASVVVEPGAHGPLLAYQAGSIPVQANVQALLGQRNPLIACLQSGQVTLTARLDSRSEWSGSPLLANLGAQSFICLPLRVAGQVDSAVFVASKSPLPPFSTEDEQTFSLLARQCGAAVEGLNQLHDTRHRLEEVRVLLDFSRRLSSLDPVSVLHILLDSVRSVLPAAQAGFAALWDVRRRELVPQAASGYADTRQMLAICYRSGEGLPGRVFESAAPARLDEVDFASHYNLAPENLLRYRNATAGMLPVSCLALPIQQTQSNLPLGVLLLDNFKETAAFNEEAQALVTSLTTQTALMLENTRLFQAAEQRAAQLQALSEVAALISSSLEPDELIASLLDRLEGILPYQTGTLWLRQGAQLVVRAARGFADSEERIGLSAAIADSLLLDEMIRTERPIVVENINQDARFPALIEHENLSWLGVPMIASGEVIGVIALEHREAGYYTPEHVQASAAFASQAAVALENAQLYQQSLGRAGELDERSRRMEMLNRLSVALSESLDPDRLINYTLAALHDSLQCSVVSAVLFDKTGRPLLQSEYPPNEIELPIVLPPAPLFERLRETQSVFNSENISQEAELEPLAGFLSERGTYALLALSIATGSDLHGVLLAHADHPYRFTPEEVGLARTISNQAAVAIQNARQYAETRSLTEELDLRVRERTAQLGLEHQRAETLLRIITELSASLELSQVLNRTLRVLNEILQAEQIDVLIARPGEQNLVCLATLSGTAERSAGVTGALSATGALLGTGALLQQVTHQALAHWIVRQRRPALLDQTNGESLWEPAPSSLAHYQSAMAVPLMVGPEALGAILCFHTQPFQFTSDQLSLMQAAANQVAVAVNNAELYRLIRDQAEDLGQMVRSQQIETQRTKGILESVADGVLVTDANKTVSLFNDSAERILSLSRQRAIGKPLEDFIGLFGRAARSWMETIRTWSEDPESYEPGDTYQEQIELDDGRVVSVHLAPVRLRNNFLGTVSIFRDITHQVEVDRLKSEFVATVSHELRTPMTSIKGYVDLLLMGAAGPMSEAQTRFLDIVKSNTERLAILVNDLLDISRIEAGRVSLSLQPLDLLEMGRKAIDDLKRRSQQDNKPMQISFKAPASLPRARGDMERIFQILENLLENAYYYTPEGGKISLSLQAVNGEVQAAIRDNGIGIPPDLMERVFERFYRGEHPFVLATSGTGLGLSIVRTLVEMHTGRIWLESAGLPGLGSTFYFTLPVYDAESE